MKQFLDCLIQLLKPLKIFGEIQSTSSPNFMVINIRYQNLLHGSDFLCFLFTNYFKMSSRTKRLFFLKTTETKWYLKAEFKDPTKLCFGCSYKFWNKHENEIVSADPKNAFQCYVSCFRWVKKVLFLVLVVSVVSSFSTSLLCSWSIPNSIL